MAGRLDPTDFQVAVARTYFGLKASEGHVVAGDLVLDCPAGRVQASLEHVFWVSALVQ
jgi:hypothetical protein